MATRIALNFVACVLFITCILPGQALCASSITDTLSPPSQHNQIVGIEGQDKGRIKLAVEAQLVSNEKAGSHKAPIFSPEGTQLFFHEVTNIGPASYSVKCRIEDPAGKRTYQAIFSTNKDSNGLFPINVMTEDEYKSSVASGKIAPANNPSSTPVTTLENAVKTIKEAGIDPDKTIDDFVLVSDVDGVVRADKKGIDPGIADAVKALVESGKLSVRYISGSAVMWPEFIKNEAEAWRRDNPPLAGAFVDAFGADWLAAHQDRVEVVGAMGGQRLTFIDGKPAVEFIEKFRYTDEQIFEGLKMIVRSFLIVVEEKGTDTQTAVASELLKDLAEIKPAPGEELTGPEGAKTPDAFKNIMLRINKDLDPNSHLVNRGSDLEMMFTREKFFSLQQHQRS